MIGTILEKLKSKIEFGKLINTGKLTPAHISNYHGLLVVKYCKCFYLTFLSAITLSKKNKQMNATFGK